MRSSETICSRNKAFSLKSTLVQIFHATAIRNKTKFSCIIFPSTCSTASIAKILIVSFVIFRCLCLQAVFFFLKSYSCSQMVCVNNMYITRYCDYMCVNKFIQYSQINEQVKNLDNTFVHFRNSRLGVKGKRKGRQKTVMRYSVRNRYQEICRLF